MNGNDLTISPAIIPKDQAGTAFDKYANVTITPADGANITVLNTATAQPSIFWCKDAVEMFHGKLNVDDMTGGGVSVMKETTDSGIEIVFLKESSLDLLSTKYRLSCWMRPHVLEPTMAGIYLPNQAAAFG